MPGKGWDAPIYVREWSLGPPVCPGEFGMPFRMSGSGQDALSDDREWS